MENKLITIKESPKIPTTWEYEKSIEKTKNLLYKWKNLTLDVFEELYIAREKLNSQGKRNDLTSGQKSQSWSEYCKEIGSSRRVVNRWLEGMYGSVKKDLPLIKTEFRHLTNRDSHMWDLSSEIDGDFDEDVLCIDPVHGENDIREYKEYYPTVTRLSNLYHPNGKEFTIREYADIQDFPKDFNFVGPRQAIKDQIGEAVDPIMGEYILKKYSKGKTYIELFCGCGGFSVAAEKLGKKCLWAIDFNRYAGHAFKLNFPEVDVTIQDIRKIDPSKVEIEKPDLIMGGPPCQGFSNAGKRLGFREDPRNKLYLEFKRFVDYFQPKEFIMENVKEILHNKEEIIKDFKEYHVQTELVNGLDVGMKQKRIRAFFIGKRK